MREYSHDERATIYQNMQDYGGSFIKALSECFMKADIFNRRKLVIAFPDEFERYLNM